MGDSAGGISPVLRMVQTFPLSPTVIAMTFTELSDPELSALTPLEERDLAMEILVDLSSQRLAWPRLDKPGTRLESSPSDLPLDVKLDSQLDSPGLNTTLTGSSLRLECNLYLSIVILTL